MMLLIGIVLFLGALFVLYLFTTNPEGVPVSEKEKPVSYPVNAKYYSEVIAHLDEKGYSFTDMKTAIAGVSFVSGKTPEEIRGDIWAEVKKRAPDGYPMASANPPDTSS
jgi:hypothetical protein